MASDDKVKNTQRFSFSLDYKIIATILLVVVAGMLILWKPWSQNKINESRTITVNGEALVIAVPDEFVFYPHYSFTNEDKAVASAEANKKADEVTKKLIELGVAETQIKTSVDGWGGHGFIPESKTEKYTYGATLTIKLSDKSLVQKVQDYLLASSAEGTITPIADFSDEKKKQLEIEGRDIAAKDARKKAEQSAKNLGFKITKVKSVKDRQEHGDFIPLDASRSSGAEQARSSASSLKVYTGEQEIKYIVEVTYYFN